MTVEEIRTRIETAALYRLVDYFRWSDLTDGYVVSRAPGDPGNMFVYSHGERPGEVRASQLHKVSVDGPFVQGALDQPELAALQTPAAIFAARPDIQCVLHFHSKATMVFSSLDCDLMPVSQGGVMLHGKVSYDAFNEDVWGEDCNRAIVEGFRENQVVLLRNHGAIVGGTTVLQAFRIAYYLEQACAVQVEMMQTGRRIIAPDAAYAREAQKGYWANHMVAYDGTRDWPALIRMLDRMDPSYKT